MLVSGIVVKTVAGRAGAVAARLARVEGLQIAGSPGEDRVAAVWTAEDAVALQLAAEQLLKTDADILGIYPTFVANA